MAAKMMGFGLLVAKKPREHISLAVVNVRFSVSSVQKLIWCINLEIMTECDETSLEFCSLFQIIIREQVLPFVAFSF